MVHYFKKALAGLVLLLCFSNTNAKIILVNDIGDTGVGTLRDGVSNANPGDTVMVNVKGTILLNNPINIFDAITILGAFPIHSIIDCSGLGSIENAFFINGTGGGLSVIQGFTIKNCSQSAQAIYIQGTSQVKILDCLFEGNNGPSAAANGQCIANFIVGGSVEIYNCSFIGNSSINPGGAIAINANSGQTKIRNCTFYQNSANTSQGGAIYNDGNNTSITNCTFLDNTAGSGADVYNDINGMIEIGNNIFSNGNPLVQFNTGSGTWNNQGGNAFGAPSANYASFFTLMITDVFAINQGALQIASVPIIDGYGLEYIRINQQSSPCVDNGILSVPVLPADCRRAPRIMQGGVSLMPDAGAVEFTQFTVASTSPGAFQTAWNNMNGNSPPGPHYMDFNMPGAGSFTITTELYNNNLAVGEDWIVDGFTQPGSAIPGPGNSPNNVTPGVFSIKVTQNNANNMFFLERGAAYSLMSGLFLDNNNNGFNTIEIYNTNFTLFGNKIVSSNIGIPAGKSGIVTTGVADVTIGGPRHHMRNVISQQGYGIYQQSPHVRVQGNFIGTTDNGMAALANFIGIRQEGGTMDIDGKFGYPSMNLLSGSLSAQFVAMTGSYFNIFGNIIGPDYTTFNSLATGASGVIAMFNTDGYIGNGGPLNFNVISGNIEGLHIEGANAVSVLGNYIGLSPLGTVPAVANQTGINIINNGDANHLIGDGTYKGRNYISGNSGFGIHSNGSSGHTIRGNFIGLKPDNSAMGNGGAGIFIDNASDSYIIWDNVISSNADDGIFYNNSGDNDVIQNNKIGTDSTGTIARGNSSHGIRMNVPASGILIQNNLVSGNGGDGIQVNGPSSPLQILGNTIGLDITNAFAIPNTGTGVSSFSGDGTIVQGNIIAGNQQHGVQMGDMAGFYVLGNYIGTNPSYTAGIPNSLDGVLIQGSSTQAMIGGTVTTDKNVIVGNGDAGVKVDVFSTDIGILNNEMYNNGALGISLGGASPLVNDLGDADGSSVAGNKGRNYPDNLNAQICAGVPVVTGTIETDAAGNYLIQVYKITNGVDPSGYGEGDVMVYEQTFNFIAIGTNTFSITLPGTVLQNDILSLTSSFNPFGTIYETSEFSDTVLVRGASSATATVVSNVSCAGGTDGSATVTVTGSSGPFTFDWINTGTGISTGQTTQTATLPAGTYYCTVDDGTCIIGSDTITITEPPSLIVDAGIDDAICAGDPFVQNATVLGGTPPYSVTWTPAIDFVDNTLEDAVLTSIASNTVGVVTYTMNVSDANGCAGSDNMILTVNALPLVNAGPDFNVCQGNSATLSGSGASSYVWDNSVLDGMPFNPSSTLTYTVIGTDANGCQNTDQVVITVDVPYTINAGADFTICESALTIPLSGSTNSTAYNWTSTGPGTFNPSNTVLNPDYNVAAADISAGSVTFTLVTNANGACPVLTDDVLVTFDAAPLVDAGTLPASMCNNSAVTLNGTVSNATAQLWSTGGTGSFSDATTLITTYTSGVNETGLVTFFLTTNANGSCPPEVDSVSITFLDVPVAIALSDTSICSGQVFTLDGSTSTGTISSYQWDEVGVGTFSNTAAVNVSPLTSTNYALTVSNGVCSDIDTVLITVIAAPDPTFSYASSSYCNDALNEAPSLVMTPGGVFDLPASPANINSSTGDITFNTLTPGTYDVVYTLSTPCFSNDTIQINILALPTADAGADVAICVGDTAFLNGIGSGTFFDWAGTNGFTSTSANDFDIPSGNTDYVLTVTDPVGCSNADTISVTLNPGPTGTISGGGTFCEGTPNTGVIVTNNSSNPWDLDFFVNGNPDTTVTPGSQTFNLPDLNTAGDAGTWTAIIHDLVTGCSATVSGSVTMVINPEPTMPVNSLYGCTTDNAVDLNSLLTPTPSGGVWSGPGVSDPVFSPNTAGAGTWDLIYTVGTGCDDTVQVVINASPTITITNVSANYCETDPPFIPVGSPPGGEWFLNAVSTGTSLTVDPSTLPYGLNSISYQYTDTVTGCTGTAIPPIGFNVYEMPLGPTTTSPLNQSVCSGSTVTLNATNPNSGNGVLTWFSDSGLTNQIGLGPTITTVPLTSNTTIYLTILNGGCITNIIIFNITVNNAQVSAGPDITICPGTEAQLNVTSVSGTIMWSPGTSLNDSTIQNPIATPNVNTSYVVVVTDGPCVAADTIDVVIDGTNPDCGITPSYNAFSPDGDNVNDEWIIDAAFVHPDNTVTIFNRWGDVLVTLEDYDNVNVVWDGTYKGNLLPSGTYFYMIEYHDINMQISGWVQLTR